MIRRFAFAAIAASVLFLAACGGQQAPQMSDAQRKAQEGTQRLSASEGGKIVLRAIEAHGGLEAWYSAPTSSFTWEYSNAGMNGRFKTRAVVDNNTRQAYHQILAIGTPDEPKPYEGSFAWDGEKAWIYPADTPIIAPRFWALTGYYFQQIPFVLADPGLSYEVLPDAELDGKPYDMVRASFGSGIGDSPGDTYTLYVDKETDMVAGIRYTVTYGRQPRAAGDEPPGETLMLYQDYTTVDGLTVPKHFYGSNFANGEVVNFKNEAWADEISYTQPFDATQLEMPEGAKIQPPPGQ
ncbi:MAG: hypothetical protein O3A53_20620 [Acidobacteria bacterium]|nr:hypothetical protein [Acidobacteriota bacterium]MDA1237183.1 hypothetical protein [Acidobacteriota bacterium]